MVESTGFQEVYFHRLSSDGQTVEETIKLDDFERKIDLDQWYAVDGKGCLVDRISFDRNRLDVFLKPISTN
jgi:hypothetical protein